jgi:conjugal transfer/entry exclusion protein
MRHKPSDIVNQKLFRLKSNADAAHACLLQVSEQIRDTRDQFHALDRHRASLKARGHQLTAFDQKQLDDLAKRLASLLSTQELARANHKARRKIADRCEKVVLHGA